MRSYFILRLAFITSAMHTHTVHKLHTQTHTVKIYTIEPYFWQGRSQEFVSEGDKTGQGDWGQKSPSGVQG